LIEGARKVHPFEQIAPIEVLEAPAQAESSFFFFFIKLLFILKFKMNKNNKLIQKLKFSNRRKIVQKVAGDANPYKMV